MLKVQAPCAAEKNDTSDGELLDLEASRVMAPGQGPLQLVTRGNRRIKTRRFREIRQGETGLCEGTSNGGPELPLQDSNWVRTPKPVSKLPTLGRQIGKLPST